MQNILIGVQVFCWPKIINPLGQKSAFGRFLSCVGKNMLAWISLFLSLINGLSLENKSWKLFVLCLQALTKMLYIAYTIRNI
jgi:hypothetical protein